MAGKSLPAPRFPDSLAWFNAPAPVDLADCRGRVVLLNFSAYCSLPCIGALDDLAWLAHRYPGRVQVIGVHMPRFPGERTDNHIRQVLARYDIGHPVIHDADGRLAHLYGIRHDPTVVVIDPAGRITGATTGRDRRHKLDRVTGYLLDRAGQLPGAGRMPHSTRRRRRDAQALAFPARVFATNTRVFIADSGHHRILVTGPHGQVLQQFGSSTPGFVDGTGTAAAFNNPQAMLFTGEFLYVADTGNHAIRRVHPHSGDVVTIAGSGRPGSPPAERRFADPPVVDLNAPAGLAHHDSVLYIAMGGMHQVWALSLVTNTLEVIAGSGACELVDGTADRAGFAQPSALAVAGNTLYVADAESSAIRAVDLATRHVRTLAGAGRDGCGYHDGTTREARFQYPLDLNVDPGSGVLWIADTYNNKIRRMQTLNDTVSSVRVDRPLNQPGGVAFRGNTLYIANTNRHEILRLDLHNGHAETLDVNDELGQLRS